MGGHDRDEEMIARSQRCNTDRPAFEIGNAADTLFPKELKAADMHAGEHGDRSTAIDDGYPLRRKVRIEIHPTACDCLIDLGAGLPLDILDLGEAFGPQQFLGDKLGSVAE